MKLLAIETATEACSAALFNNGELTEKYQLAPRKHAELILQMINDLLQEANVDKASLDAVAFGRGPGAFTGVRIAAGVTQGIAFALDIPVIPVSTLAALAQSHTQKHDHVAAAIDARMSEVYWGLFVRDDAGLMTPICVETVCTPYKVTLPENGEWFGTGSGWDSYHDVLSQALKGKCTAYEIGHFPRASSIIRLACAAYEQGDVMAAENAVPVYLRNKII